MIFYSQASRTETRGTYNTTQKATARSVVLSQYEYISNKAKMNPNLLISVKKNLEELVTEVMLLKCARKQEEDACKCILNEYELY